MQETAGNMKLVENPVRAASWNQPSIQGLQNAPIVFEDISHLCMFGVKDPRSRRALKRPVRYLTNSRELLKFVVRKCPNKHVHGPVKGLTNAYRSSSRWHTRAWEQSSDQGSGERQRLEAFEPKMWKWILQGTAIPDDEFHEEPHLEEAKVPEEIPNVVRLAIMRIHKNLEHPSKELLCRALRIGGANRIAIRAASQLKCDACSENKPPKSHLPAKLADTYTEFNQGVGVDLFCACGLRRTSVQVPEHSRSRHEIQHLLSSAIQRARRRLVST